MRNGHQCTLVRILDARVEALPSTLRLFVAPTSSHVRLYPGSLLQVLTKFGAAHDDYLCDRPGELGRLRESARELESLGVDGIVVGFEREDGWVIDRAIFGPVGQRVSYFPVGPSARA